MKSVPIAYPYYIQLTLARTNFGVALNDTYFRGLVPISTEDHGSHRHGCFLSPACLSVAAGLLTTAAHTRQTTVASRPDPDGLTSSGFTNPARCTRVCVCALRNLGTDRSSTYPPSDLHI